MLIQLKIENIALIEIIEINFEKGLSVKIRLFVSSIP